MSNVFQPQVKGKVIDDSVTVALSTGEIFHGWKNITITKNLDSLANSFSMSLFDSFNPQGDDWPLKPGVKLEIFIGSERVLGGRIDILNASYAPGSRSLTISGRSLPGDLVDASVSGSTEFNNIALDDLAKQLVAPFGIKVFLSVVPSIIEKFATKLGESVFEALDRAARLQGFFWISTRAGNIRLTRAAKEKSFSEIHQDVNMLSGSVTLDTTMRHDKYTVLGQSFGTCDFFGQSVSSPFGEAFDAGITRHRPKTIIAESSIDSAKAKDRAEWEATNRLAQGTQLSCSVRGWRQENDELWGINQRTRIRAKFLGINSGMLSTSVVHIKNNSAGTITNITFVPPDSFDPQPIIPKSADLLDGLGPDFGIF